VGPQDGREDPAPSRRRRCATAYHDLPRRLRRRAHHRAGADVPRRRARRADLLQRVRMSGVVPQVGVLFGPSAAGGAYIPAFCDNRVMREWQRVRCTSAARMAEMGSVRGHARGDGRRKMHTGVSGCGHVLARTDEEGIDAAKPYLSFLPTTGRPSPRPRRPRAIVDRADRRHRPRRREQGRHARPARPLSTRRASSRSTRSGRRS